MDVFQVHHLVFDNQLVCSSLGKTVSPALRIPSWPVALCVGLRSHEFSMVHISMSVSLSLLRRGPGKKLKLTISADWLTGEVPG